MTDTPRREPLSDGLRAVAALGSATRAADPSGLREAIQFDAIPTLLIFAEDNAGVRAVITKLRAALDARPEGGEPG